VPGYNRTGRGMVKMADEGVGARSEEFQDNLESKINGLGRGKYGRILQMAHTPDMEEYRKTCKIAAIGMVILGAVGFVIMWIMTYLPNYF